MINNKPVSNRTFAILVLSIVAVLIVLGCISAKAQKNDTTVIIHKTYTSVFCNSAHIPVLVYYTLHKTDLDCSVHIKRTNNFKADPLLKGTDLSKDYAGSGYDQGHNMSAQDNQCSSIGMSECFYYTNMFPQTSNLNRGIWKKLEIYERNLAMQEDSVIVFIGSYGMHKVIGPDQVWVPEYCWKVIYEPAKSQYTSYVYSNTDAAEAIKLPDTNMQGKWMHYVINKFTKYKY